MFQLESPHRGDSNEYTQLTIINKKRKSPEIIPNRIVSAVIGFSWLGTQERVRDSCGKRAIIVRPTVVLLYWKSNVGFFVCFCLIL